MKLTPEMRAVLRPRVAPVPHVPVQGTWECAGTFVRRFVREAKPGECLAAVVGELTRRPEDTRVYIITQAGLVYGPIPPEQWRRLYVKLGTRIVVQIVPFGGRREGSASAQDDKSTERLLLQLLIVVVAALATWYIGGVGGLIVGAAINIGGNLLLNMLMPPTGPPIKKARLTGRAQREQQSMTLSITGARNRANPYGPVPVIFGQHGLFPGFAP